MSLTELEKDVIKAIGGNQYADVPADPIWVFAVEYDTKIVTKKQISGVISSLSKKGLLVTDGETVHLTPEGVIEYNKIKEN